jgi:hypothetical protein
MKIQEALYMSATVSNIFENLSPSYRLKCIAGKSGINSQPVHWVSVVEDDDVKKFRNTNEIILTSGLRNSHEDYLLKFAQKLNQANACALIINIGPYIKEIPKNLIDFCNETNLPLFVMPWEILMVDVVRDICHFIIYEETTQSNISELVQNIIFKTENIESQIKQLERYGFSKDSIYCPAILKIQVEGKDDYDALTKHLGIYCEEITGSTSTHKCISFVYNRLITLIFVDYTKELVENFITSFYKNLPLKFLRHKIYMCIGSNKNDIYSLSVNFKRILPLIKVAIKNDTKVLYYDSAGIYKILAEVNDLNVLKEYYDETIGPIIRYDGEKLTDLYQFIKSYILLDGNVQAVAEKHFVHRNTVNNQLKKIEKITGIDPFSVEGKARFSIALKILDLYAF